MIRSMQIPVYRLSMNWWAIVLILLYGTIMIIALKTYMVWQSVNVMLGVIALPAVSVINPLYKRSVRYAIAALLIGLLSFWLPVKTMLYGTIVFAGFFIAESFAGKTNLLPLLVVGLMSPVFQYISNVFSFPIRLRLTEWSGQMMNTVSMATVVKGNMILYNGNEFAVDPACMGLNMMVTSLLIQIILIAIYQKRSGSRLVWWQVFVLMGVITGLNIISNLFRIICLVRFNILPHTLMHELTGIICLLVYVIIPAAFITRLVVKKFGKKVNPVDSGTKLMPVKKMIVLHSLLLIVTFCSAFTTMKYDNYINDATAAVAPVPGYKVQRISADIIKLDNAQSMIYIKTIPGFYNSDHNPMICWRGNGYTFQQVGEQVIDNTTIYTALLQNEKDQLHTAWWYDNGSKRTIDQLTWRWDVLRGANNYSIVNVTSPDKEQLISEIRELLRDNRLQPLLRSTN
jgi:exosortase N